MPHHIAPSSFDGMSFSPPEEFDLVETMFSLRLPIREELQDPRMIQGILNKRIQIQPNLIIHRRSAKQDASLEEYVGEACAELLKTIGNLEAFEKRTFTFSDQQEGFLVSFLCPATKTDSLRQYHAYRLDDGKITTLALTVDAKQASKDQEQRYLQTLASLCRTSERNP
ncbi:MAG: hypothetical protein H6728_17735 [Myxococcales bacterium]|nr:hypothetical protein [Myxococcales bacterium]MCB9644917.1 hypothetical protein [Myxococcales bacterium]